MTKKHYKALAKELAAVRGVLMLHYKGKRLEDKLATWEACCQAVCLACASECNNFDSKLFFKACETVEQTAV